MQKKQMLIRKAPTPRRSVNTLVLAAILGGAFLVLALILSAPSSSSDVVETKGATNRPAGLESRVSNSVSEHTPKIENIGTTQIAPPLVPSSQLAKTNSALTVGKTAPISPPPPGAPEGPPASHDEHPDLFDALRQASTSSTRAEPDWRKSANALSHLKSLHGASVDPVTGQLIFCGDYSDAPGPFKLEDLSVALRAPFREIEPLGMTIDEDAKDKYGPSMIVRFFGGSLNTHLGQVMFEVDRLMKCFGQGLDNVTKTELRPKLTNFFTHTEISVSLNEDISAKTWDRFWANLNTGRFSSNDLRGKPLIELSRDRQTAWLTEHRIWIDTEQMIDPGVGKRLASTGGKQSESASQFTDRLTGLYAEIGKQFTAFQDLHELSKLAVVAEWLREKSLPFDPELFHLGFASGPNTPTRTPSLSSTNEWRQGNTIRQIRAFGGVMLDPKPRYITSKQPQADPLADNIQAHRSELRKGEVIRMPRAEGPDQLMIPFGPSERGPPAPTALADGARIPTRVVEVQGRARVALREADDPVLRNYEIHVWIDPATGRQMLNLPVLRTEFNARKERSVTFSGGASGTVKIPDQVYVTSPNRNIHVQFETKPQYDQTARAPYFPSAKADYYPNSRTVRLKDGTAYQFDEAGVLNGVTSPDGVSLKIQAVNYQDGSFHSEASPNTRARPPPVRKVEARTSGAAALRNIDLPGPNAETRCAVRNEKTGHSMEVREDGGRLFFLMQ